MFTGIVEEVGTVVSVSKKGSSLRLTVSCPLVSSDAGIGDSISVNGVCLTITDINGKSLSFDVVPETVRKTSLVYATAGKPVNLERAMAANGRYGGHIVSGHVDTIGTVISLKKEDNAVVVALRPKQTDLLRYMVPRGSITLDGISLTLNEVAADFVTVSIIPHTWDNTVFRGKQVGDIMNIEVDILAKYIERLLGFNRAGHDAHNAKNSNITETYLADYGFMGG